MGGCERSENPTKQSNCLLCGKELKRFSRIPRFFRKLGGGKPVLNRYGSTPCGRIVNFSVSTASVSARIRVLEGKIKREKPRAGEEKGKRYDQQEQERPAASGCLFRMRAFAVEGECGDERGNECRYLGKETDYEQQAARYFKNAEPDCVRRSGGQIEARKELGYPCRSPQFFHTSIEKHHAHGDAQDGWRDEAEGEEVGKDI